jgi:hypothetical protein
MKPVYSYEFSIDSRHRRVRLSAPVRPLSARCPGLVHSPRPDTQAVDLIQLNPVETPFLSTFSKKLFRALFSPNFSKIKRLEPAQKQTGVNTCRATVYHSLHIEGRLFERVELQATAAFFLATNLFRCYLSLTETEQ